MKNPFQIIQIIGSMQGLFLFFLLVIRKENRLANKVLAFLILLISVNLATSFLHTNNDMINDFSATARSDMFLFCYGPAIAFYTLFLTGFKEKIKPIYFFQLGPAVVLFLMLIFSRLYSGDAVNLSIWEDGNPYSFRLWYIIHSGALIHLSAYLFYSLYVVNRYKTQVNSYFAQSGRIRLLWLHILLLSMLLCCVLSVFQFAINLFHEPEGILQWIISITVVILVFATGYLTYWQPDILEDLKSMNEEKKEKYERNRLDEDEERSSLNKLLKYVEEHKPYLDPELNLKLLSEGVGLPTHQLSMLLSIYLQQNFYTFVNEYRIKEAKLRLAADDSKEHNILTIAFDTGFNSKSTFNSVFKKYEGVTPSEYRLKNQRSGHNENL